jgi:hypothetical protein
VNRKLGKSAVTINPPSTALVCRVGLKDEFANALMPAIPTMGLNSANERRSPTSFARRGPSATALRNAASAPVARRSFAEQNAPRLLRQINVPASSVPGTLLSVSDAFSPQDGQTSICIWDAHRPKPLALMAGTAPSRCVDAACDLLRAGDQTGNVWFRRVDGSSGSVDRPGAVTPCINNFTG